TDATGTIAMPNLRGIMVMGMRYARIEHNVISGNRLSAIWLVNAFMPAVGANRIGVAADGKTPLPNGASGVYVGIGTDWPSFTNNVIANNGEFGIAVHPSVRRLLAIQNSIYDNHHLGIDYGLDLATPNAPSDLGRMPNTPTLTSARYDAATNTTIVEGTLVTSFEAPPLGNRARVVLYANDNGANPQAQTLLGVATFIGEGAFRFTMKGDLRGKFITSITHRYRKAGEGTLEEYSISDEISEISPAVAVQ
ncbi:MAG: right-handed parallel beta-helix repeat-containing protein, partial [Acidobacteriota bacterium]|nr:right-handed parallel beta-helix repeat-containing protein [Acidobacteriota bacterium]